MKREENKRRKDKRGFGENAPNNGMCSEQKGGKEFQKSHVLRCQMRTKTVKNDRVPKES